MYDILSGLSVVECSSFIAAPSCGLHLRQLGAEVIRIDTIGGGPDGRRWPLAPGGDSLYWEGLNKDKKSVTVDLGSEEGRELAVALATAPGPNAGILVTNFPATGFLSHDRLKARRADMIILRVMGRADGRTAVDYTVNSAFGVPYMTGPESLGAEPVNHVLPAWDLMAGAYGAFALLAAERHRRETGAGQEVRVPLDDLAAATLGHLGQIAEVSLSGADRSRHGNDIFGAFGRDFSTADGQRVMVAAITRPQWSGLVAALGIEAEVAAVELACGESLAGDEGARFRHRAVLNPIVGGAIARRTYADIAQAFDANRVCWGPYHTLAEALEQEPTLSEQNPVFARVAHRSGQSYLTPGAAATFTTSERLAPGTAPRLGAHTDEVLESRLGLGAAQLSDLHARRIIGGRA